MNAIIPPLAIDGPCLSIRRFDEKTEEVRRWRAVILTGHREYLDENLGKPWVLRMLLAEFSSVLYAGLGNCSDEELHVRMTDNPSTRYATAVIDGINRDGSEVFGATREVGVDLQKLVTQAGMTVNSSKQRK